MEDLDGWNALTDVASQLRGQISETLYVQSRAALFEKLREARSETHGYLKRVMSDKSDAARQPEFRPGSPVLRYPKQPARRSESRRRGHAHFEVHAVRPALRSEPRWHDPEADDHAEFLAHRDVKVDPGDPDSETFDFRGGCTLIFDLEGEAPSLRYAITRRIDDEARLADIRAYRRGEELDGLSLRETYFHAATDDIEPETLQLPAPGGVNMAARRPKKVEVEARPGDGVPVQAGEHPRCIATGLAIASCCACRRMPGTAYDILIDCGLISMAEAEGRSRAWFGHPGRFRRAASISSW